MPMDSATAMAASMAAMMLPTAVPFFAAYARRVRRPAPTALVVATYAATWAVIGAAAYLVMTLVTLPSGLYVAGIVIAFAGLYALTPWKRHGEARCQEMCREPAPDGELRTALEQSLVYFGGCVACSAGVMVALLVLGMTNIALMVAGSALILLYKTAGRWPQRSGLAVSAALVVVGVWQAGVH
jgi:predicted metal-binding membrane protein